jgi:hypothetical protein
MLIRSSELSDRCMTIARVMISQEIVKTMIDMQSKENQSCEMKATTMDKATFTVSCENLGNLELIDIFESSSEWEDPFSFLSLRSFDPV